MKATRGWSKQASRRKWNKYKGEGDIERTGWKDEDKESDEDSDSDDPDTLRLCIPFGSFKLTDNVKRDTRELVTGGQVQKKAKTELVKGLQRVVEKGDAALGGPDSDDADAEAAALAAPKKPRKGGGTGSAAKGEVVAPAPAAETKPSPNKKKMREISSMKTKALAGIRNDLDSARDTIRKHMDSLQAN
eukprot:2533276-Alexandrium_andersonii.AAC.1